MKLQVLLILAGGLMVACSVPKEKESEKAAEEKVIENPAAEGFNMEGSDPKAISIADEVMTAMGGRKNWNNTRYITWNFFGARLVFHSVGQ